MFLLFVLTIFLSCGRTAINTSLQTKKVTLQSNFVKDSFDIYITLPLSYYSSSKLFPVIFYLDANLKSGNVLRNIIDEHNKQGQVIKIHILPGAKKMKAFLESESFTGLHFEYHELAGETHNSEVPLALNRILPGLKLD